MKIQRTPLLHFLPLIPNCWEHFYHYPNFTLINSTKYIIKYIKSNVIIELYHNRDEIKEMQNETRKMKRYFLLYFSLNMTKA